MSNLSGATPGQSGTLFIPGQVQDLGFNYNHDGLAAFTYGSGAVPIEYQLSQQMGAQPFPFQYQGLPPSLLSSRSNTFTTSSAASVSSTSGVQTFLDGNNQLMTTANGNQFRPPQTTNQFISPFGNSGLESFGFGFQGFNPQNALIAALYSFLMSDSTITGFGSDDSGSTAINPGSTVILGPSPSPTPAATPVSTPAPPPVSTPAPPPPVSTPAPAPSNQRMYIRDYHDNKTINGSQFDDYIGSMGDNKTLNAGQGNDKIYVYGTNRGTVNAGDGDDLIRLSNTSRDLTVNGGSGNDRIYIDNSGGGINSIMMGEHIIDGGSGTDTIYLRGSASDYTITQQGGMTVYRYNDGGSYPLVVKMTDIESVQFFGTNSASIPMAPRDDEYGIRIMNT